MKKSCHYGRTKWTAIFDGRSYIFMTTISMGEAGGTLRPLEGFWFLSKPTATVNSHRTGSFRPLAGFWFLNLKLNIRSGVRQLSFPSPCGGASILASPVATGEVASNASRWGMEYPLITYARFHQRPESHHPQQYPVSPAESLHTH